MMERVKQRFTAQQATKWIFIGDSITHGALHTFGWRDYVELFAERVRYELGRGMDVVINTGLNGDTTRGMLETFDWRVAQFRPDVVFVMFGMNDCSTPRQISAGEFDGNLRRLTEQIEALGAVPVLQTTCPILAGLAPEREPSFGSYMNIIRRIAADRRLPLIDHEQFWRARPTGYIYLLSDALHPNEFGHRAFAECLFRELGIHDPKSQCCRLHIP